MKTRSSGRFTRRRFLQSAASLSAASTLPKWCLEETARAATSVPSPNDQPAIALIGCGGQGRYDATLAAKFGRVVALCDVDESHLAAAKKTWPEAATYHDFRRVLERRDLHAIICGTVDHWHAIISIGAMRAGKDVYCEKPLTLCVDEGKHIVKAMRQTGRILQTGSQQRSDKNFRLACELVRNGRIGKLRHIEVWLPAGPRLGPFNAGPVPAGFDWNFWQGQTPFCGYVKERSHFSFRYWWDYSGGTMTDWGAHHHDIALWGAGFERSGPVEINAKPLVDMIPGGFTAHSQFHVDFVYPNGVTQTTRSTTDDNPSGGVVNKEGHRHGVKFIGANGWIWVTRGNIQASDPDLLQQPLPAGAIRLYASDNHMGNFFDCLRSRKQPICDAEIGHRSATVCHLSVISLRLGRKVRWDPMAEKIIDDPAANNLLAREMRTPWTYEMV